MTTPGATIDVATTGGRVRGRVREGSAAFSAIPYAEAPVGALRYAAPRPRAPWPGTLDATAPGATSQRRTSFGGAPFVPEPSHPGEDILTVNVFTPLPLRAGRELPVLVWIHGGGYVAGSPTGSWFDGRTYNRDGVVLVTVGYRLGFEGFGVIDGAPDNRAVRDWLLALEWVRDNVERFGGDPGRVTISGQSAGGHAVLTLLACERAQGLFARAIAQSPAFDQVPREVARERTARMAALLGVEATAEGFASRDLDAVLDAQWAVAPMRDEPEELARQMLTGRVPGMPFCPVVDGDLVRGPIPDALAAGVGAGVPLVVGATADEFMMITARMADVMRDVDPVAAMVEHGFPEDVARAYVAQTGAGGLMDVVGRLMSDRTFRHPVVASAELRPEGTTWVYDFRWPSPLSGLATHCIELPFTFDCVRGENAANVLGDHPPQEVADRLHGAWVSFVRGDDPGWPAYRPDRAGLVVERDGVRVRHDPYRLTRDTLAAQVAP